MNGDYRVKAEVPEYIPTKKLDLEKLDLQEKTVLKDWKTQHKIEKHEGTGVLTHLIRSIGLITSSIFLVAFLPFVGIYNLGVKLKEKFTIKFLPESVLSSIRSMKTKEEKDKFKTMKASDIPQLDAKRWAQSLVIDLEKSLTDEALIQKKGVRYILRNLSKKENFNPKWIEALKDPEVFRKLRFEENQGIPQEFIDAINEKNKDLDITDINWEKVSRKVLKEKIKPKDVKQNVARFERALTQLLKTLKTADVDSNPAKANQRFIADFRRVLENPVYKAIKEDPTQPAVELLHQLASNIWNKAPAMDAYRNVGTSIVREMGIEEKAEKTLSGAEIAKHLEESHQIVADIHWHNENKSALFSYALTHPRQMMGAFASEGGFARQIPGMVGLDEYDSHGTLSNNPSLQGVTDVDWVTSNGEEMPCSVHNCYGGSPTIGDHKIAPEFEALLQAAENNQLAELRDQNIPMIVNYDNLQNIDKKHGEGPRSRTIMLLNKKYPLSFRGSTVAKDSDLYLMKDGPRWESPSQFGEIMLKELNRSFIPGETGHGFYFHGSKERWGTIFIEVIANANEYFEQQLRENPEIAKMTPEELQGAYQEYVYSLLRSVKEMESLKTLIDRGIKDPKIMTISACKENIDRGGMDNTKYMYTRLDKEKHLRREANPTEAAKLYEEFTAKRDKLKKTDKDGIEKITKEYNENLERLTEGSTAEYAKERLSYLMGVMHSRALSARDRVILRKRMTQVLSFMKVTEPEVFMNKQNELFSKLGYQYSSYEFNPQTEFVARPATVA